MRSRACAGLAMVIESDLQHRRFLLESIDGETLSFDGPDALIPELDFGEQLHVSGNLGCNRFNGQGVLRGGRFVVEAMASTRRMCAPPANELERTVQAVLGQESAIALGDDGALTLTSAETSLRFRRVDRVG